MRLPQGAPPGRGPHRGRNPVPGVAGVAGGHVHTGPHALANLHANAHADTNPVAHTDTDIDAHGDAPGHTDAFPDAVRSVRQPDRAPRRALLTTTVRAAGRGHLRHLPVRRAALGQGSNGTPVHGAGGLPTAVCHPAHRGGDAGVSQRHPGPRPPRTPPFPAAGGARRDRALRGRRPCGGGGLSGLQPGYDLGHDSGRQRPCGPRDPRCPLVPQDPPVHRAPTRAD